jgi:hypothetical protein
MTTVGDPALYAEHAEFHGHVLRLLHALRVDALAALDALQAHAREHFAAEDVDLRKMGSGNANRHLDEHAAVLKSLAEVRAVLAGESAGMDMAVARPVPGAHQWRAGADSVVKPRAVLPARNAGRALIAAPAATSVATLVNVNERA